jgi:ribonuclease HI
MSLTKEEAIRLKAAVRIAGSHAEPAEIRRVDSISIREVIELLQIISRETTTEDDGDPAVSTRSDPLVDARIVPDPLDAAAKQRLVSKAETIRVWTDGACQGNPGPGGIGVVIVEGGDDTGDRPGQMLAQVSEYLGETTNNVAELTAILRGLEIALLRVQMSLSTSTCPIRVYSDSAYAIGVLSLGWRAKKNVDLVEKIRGICRNLPDLRFVKVPAHTGVVLNEQADKLATAAIDEHLSRGKVT